LIGFRKGPGREEAEEEKKQEAREREVSEEEGDCQPS
jgi:hypothetical protein